MMLCEKVSIIIPCYNSEDYIDQCIQSILNQDYNNIEIIVVDDGSSDQSLAVLNNYADKIILLSQQNEGACSARNKGLSVSTGIYIKFLDSDDYLAPNIISEQVKQIESLNSNEIVYGNYTLSYPQKNILHKNKAVSNSLTTEELINTDILTSTPLHRKTLLLKINGFDERFKHGQEWNLHVRLAAIGTKFIYYPENIYFYRIHDSEDRISNKKIFDPEYELQKCIMTLHSIESLSGNSSDSINSAMASKIWSVGRRTLQISLSAEQSKKYFLHAYKVSKKPLQFCSLQYRVLHMMFHTYRTEKIIFLIKKIFKNKKSIFRN